MEVVVGTVSCNARKKGWGPRRTNERALRSCSRVRPRPSAVSRSLIYLVRRRFSIFPTLFFFLASPLADGYQTVPGAARSEEATRHSKTLSFASARFSRDYVGAVSRLHHRETVEGQLQRMHFPSVRGRPDHMRPNGQSEARSGREGKKG